MNYLIFSIWYSPYDMVNIVWTILYGLYKTVQIVRSIRNCQFCLDAQEQILLYLRNQLQLKSPSDLFQTLKFRVEIVLTRSILLSTDWLPEISIIDQLWPVRYDLSPSLLYKLPFNATESSLTQIKWPF